MQLVIFGADENVTAINIPLPTISGGGGTSFAWRGAYASGTAYAVGDVVSFNGSSYIATQASTGVVPTNTGSWSLLAQRGTDGTGGSGGGNVSAVSMASAGIPTSPYLNTSQVRYAAEADPRLVNVGPVPWVDIRYFGAQLVAHGATATDAVAQANLIALQEALDWGYEAGGMPVIPGGILDVYGTAYMRPGSNLSGNSRHASRLRQRRIARAAGETYADLLVPDPTLRCATLTIANLILDGGWSMRQYEGAAGPNWTYDHTTMTQKVLHISTKGSTETNIGNGASGGTNASAVYAAGTDSHIGLENIVVVSAAGDGVALWGRGEMQVHGIRVYECARYGMLSAVADSFFSNITIHKTGNSGLVIRSGGSNARINNIKTWYSGLMLSTQPASLLNAAGGGGCGVEIADPGTKDVQIANLSTQDNWGASVSVQGREGIIISGSFDEAGGGRLQAQGQGFSGTRTLPRAFVRTPGTLVGAKISANLLGGARLTAADYPYMIDLQGSAVDRCQFEFRGEKSGLAPDNTTTLTMDMTSGSITGRQKNRGVLWTNGHSNANLYNEVWFENRLDYGWMTQAMLDNAAHSINSELYGTSRVYRSDGRIVVKSPAGAWVAQGA